MTTYLGYRDGDADTAWGRFYDPEMAPLSPHVVEALSRGPQPEPLLTDRADVSAFIRTASEPTEDGYAVCRDGSIRVAVRTPMPGVTPEMWAWWFAWHGSDSRRYKLWHPRAHVSAEWADGAGEGDFVGRTSIVREYLGSTFFHAAIRFVPPAEFGIDHVPDGELAVCARLGDATRPVDGGWFVHHIRPTADGAEMRSRFWMGGSHIALRGDRPGAALADRAARPVIARLLGASAQSAADLLVHCAQEMSHLAAFLPELHADVTGSVL